MGLQPSASKTDLLLQCARPFGDVDIDTSPARIEARYGSAFHLCMAGALRGQTIDCEIALKQYDCPHSSTDVAALREHVADAWCELDDWLAGSNIWDEPLTVVTIEQSYAYNLTTCILRETTLEEETHTYDLRPGEIGLTADLVFRGERSGIQGVLDHKTGKWEDYSTPSALGQMRTLGLALNAERLAILHHPPGSVSPAIYAETWSGHWKHQAALRAAFERAGDGSLRPGDECRFCPARGDCPARGVEILENAASLVGLAASALVKAPPEGMTLEAQAAAAGKLHLFLAEFERLAKLGRAELRGFVETARGLGVEVHRPDGKRLAMVSRRSERLSKKSILNALGAAEGEKMLARLREAGALVEVEGEELRAL
jgi:hypothetical protein